MTNDMTVGKPIKLILNFAIPLLIGNIFQQFYNVVDSVVVGRFIGVNALAAVGSTGSIVFLVMGMVIGCTSGFSVLIAQAFGARDEGGLRHYTMMSVYLCAAIAIVLTVISLLTVNVLLGFMKTPDEIYPEAKRYISIIYAGIAITFAYNMLSGILRALGDSKSPLYFLIVSSVLNILLDLFFVLICKMGVSGVAYATVISQAIASVCCYIYMVRKYPVLHIQKEDKSFSWNSAGKMMKIGVPMALQFSITAIGAMILQSALNVCGPVYIAAYTAAVKAQQIVTQPFASLGATMATYVGQNMGAGDMERIDKGVKDCVKITLLYSLLAILVIVLFGGQIVQIFVSGAEKEMIAAAKQYFYIIAAFLPFLSLIFVYRNSLQGLGDGFFPMLGGVFELVARGAVAFTLAGSFGYAGVCFADPAAWVSALIPLIPVYHMRIKKCKENMKKTIV